jgi:hypothetical protein
MITAWAVQIMIILQRVLPDMGQVFRNSAKTSVVAGNGILVDGKLLLLLACINQ